MKNKIHYIAINPNGSIDWDIIEDVRGKNQDDALATFLSDITWMDNWTNNPSPAVGE